MSEQADIKRDERLRRRLLATLNLARGQAPSGGLSGRRLMDETDDSFNGEHEYTGVSHFMRLCRDLVNHGLIEGREIGNRRRGQAFGPEHASFAITARGTQLIEEKIPPIAGIDDEREV